MTALVDNRSRTDGNFSTERDWLPPLPEFDDDDDPTETIELVAAAFASAVGGVVRK